MLRLEARKQAIPSLAFTPDGRTLVGAGGNNVRVWDLFTGAQQAAWSGHTTLVQCVAVSPDGQLVASGGHDRTVLVWDLASGEAELRLDGPGLGVTAVAFSADGEYLAAASAVPGGVRWWDTAAWVLRGGLSGHPVEDAEVDVPQADCGRVLSLAYTPDTRALVLGTSAGVLWWDVIAGRPRGPFAQQGCCSLALSLDGKTLVSAEGRTAHVWSVAWGTRRATLQGHKGVVTSVALSPDGRRVLTGSMDGSVRLWEAASGRQVAALDWEVGAPHCVVFALDGMRAAVGGARGAVVWDVE